MGDLIETTVSIRPSTPVIRENLSPSVSSFHHGEKRSIYVTIKITRTQFMTTEVVMCLDQSFRFNSKIFYDV